jgi:PBP1b-binding outer membrane lipoprotein LpoB
MRLGSALLIALLLAGCNRSQVAESNQSVIANQAKAYEAAADAAVDQSIAQLAQESFEAGGDNEARAQ